MTIKAENYFRGRRIPFSGVTVKPGTEYRVMSDMKPVKPKEGIIEKRILSVSTDDEIKFITRRSLEGGRLQQEDHITSFVREEITTVNIRRRFPGVRTYFTYTRTPQGK